MPFKRETAAPALLLLISLVWGSSWLATQGVRDQGTPLALGALRYGCAAVLLGVALLLLRIAARQPAVPTKPSSPAENKRGFSRGLVRDALLGLTMLAAPTALLAVSAQHNAGAWTLMYYSAMPLILSLAEGELRLPAVLAPGAMYILLNGMVPFFEGIPLWGLLSLAAVLLQAFALRYAQKHLRGMPVAQLARSVTWQCAVASLVLGVLSIAAEQSLRLLVAGWTGNATASLAALVILATVLAYTAYYVLLASYETSQLAVSQWLQLTVAVGESAWMLGAPLPWRQVAAGAALIAVSIVMLRSKEDTGNRSQGLFTTGPRE